uniref:Uncharacterized protein n=1 Tax=Haptolina brevifila TaxID=156173 RepID=A0A7S2DT32_9EUKA|mmetsp:Transcript_43473/g.86990  ORF Transcript_43473/g.86990 Transcript_43473/m.86990 type:complete len:599 (+) Transcript_43473:1287-3083(+)
MRRSLYLREKKVTARRAWQQRQPSWWIVLCCFLSCTTATVVQRLQTLSRILEQEQTTRLPVDELRRLHGVLKEQLSDPDAAGLTRVHRSVIEQDIERLEWLLACGADLESEAGPLAVRPLHLAVLAGDHSTQCLERLLAAGARPDAPDRKGTTALHAATSLNLPHVCSLLIGAGARCGKRGPKGVRPLHLAAWSNAAEAAEVLIQAGANVDATDRKRRTPCHAAASHDSAEALEVLLDGGADAERPDGRGRRALHYAVKCCRCADPQCPRTRALRLLLSSGAQPDARDEGGWSAVDVAAEHNRVAPLQLMLECGADANAKGNSGCPPLILAAHAGAREATALLIDAGASTDVRDAFGATALQAAAVGNHAEILELLLQAGAPPAAVDDAGRHAGHYAARAGSVPCLRALRRAGVDMKTPTSFGWTPLHVAANHSHPAAMSTLLQQRCPSSQPDAVGWTALHLATHRFAQGTNGCRCKHCLRLHKRRAQCMRLLLRSGSATDAADARGATPSHLCAAHDDANGLRILRAYRANLWARDGDGHRPLDIARQATAHGPSHFVRELLLLADRAGPNGAIPMAEGGAEQPPTPSGGDSGTEDF